MDVTNSVNRIELLLKLRGFLAFAQAHVVHDEHGPNHSVADETMFE